MDCDEILTRAAELSERPDPGVERHVAECAACRDALEAARSGLDALVAFESAESERPTTSADAAAAWRMRRRPGRVVRLLARAAVVLLAATGALALAGVDLRPQAPSLTRIDVDAAVDAALIRLTTRLDERDRAHVEEFRDAADWLDERRRGDVTALVGEMTSLRHEIAAVRERSLAEAAMPSLPDPR